MGQTVLQLCSFKKKHKTSYIPEDTFYEQVRITSKGHA